MGGRLTASARKTIFTLYIAPLLATCDINGAWQQAFFRAPQTTIKAASSCTSGCQGARQAHHQAFYKQELRPLVLFHHLTFNTPPLCALFVANNAPIQQQLYKSERHSKIKRFYSLIFWTQPQYLHYIYVFSSPSISLSWCFWPYRSLCQ